MLVNICDGHGFIVNVAFEILNGIYFKFEEAKTIIFEVDDAKYTLASRDNLPLKSSQHLLISAGVFNCRQDAEESLDLLFLNLKVYLNSIAAEYRINDIEIKDLSKIVAVVKSSSSASFNVIKPWKLTEMQRYYADTKAKRALNLLDMSTQAKNTTISFMLMVIALESLATAEERKFETQVFLDSLIDKIDKSNIDDDDKKGIQGVIQSCKQTGARKSTKSLIEKYAGGNTYSGKTAVFLFNECYTARSNFTHDGYANSDHLVGDLRILLTDVLSRYMHEAYVNNLV